MINNKQTAQYKASEYIYDLGNAALENGFKPDEHWQVEMATADEKQAFEKQYYPTVITSVTPEILNATFTMVKAHLNQAVKPQEPVVNDRFAEQPEYLYLVAYNTNRVRR